MSMFAISDNLIKGMKQFETMNRDMSGKLPAEMASAVNMLAHPIAGAAAMSALGVGMASQALGMWPGSEGFHALHGRQENSLIHDEIGLRHYYDEWSRRLGRSASDPYGESPPAAVPTPLRAGGTR